MSKQVSLTAIATPPRALSLFASITLVLLWGLLRIFVFKSFVFPLTYVLPMLVCVWSRDRLVLWGMALIFTVMATTKMFWILPNEAMSDFTQGANYVATLLNIGVGGLVVHLIILLRERLESSLANLQEAHEQIRAQNEELQVQAEELSEQNEELTQQTEELSQSNEELQVQREELEAQNEELQAQSEEIQVLNAGLQRRERMLQSMLDSVHALAGEKKVIGDICRAALELMGDAADFVAVMERRDNQMLVHAHSSLADDERTPAPYPIQKSFAELVLRENRTASLEDTALRPDLSFLRMTGNGQFRSVLASPLRLKDASIGVVGFYSHQSRPWTTEQFRMAEWIAAHCSLILETLRLQAGLRESEERFRAIYENAAIGIDQAAPDGRLLAVNAEICHMLDYSAEELLARTYRDLTHPEDQSQEESLVAALWRKEIPSYQIEKRYLNRHGQPVWVRVTSSLAQLSQPYRISIIEDITERKKAEARMIEQAEALKDADRCKDEFLAMLAHELRNPLAPIRNAVQVLNLIGPKEPAVIRQREIINRQVTHMAHLLDDLLDVSRITQGKIVLKKQPMCMAAVLAHAVEMTTPLVECRRHNLSVTMPPEDIHVEADPDRLAQVVSNLLANAAKFTPEGGRIWLEAAREGKQVVLRVRDTGVGLSPEMMPRVFDLFAQADRSLDRTQGGLGIGLTIVQRLVALHGGCVEVRSDGADKGSEFIVRLPILPGEGSVAF